MPVESPGEVPVDLPVDVPVKVQWISHRGLSDEEAEGTVENTLTSFQLAVDDGFDWLETDIRISTDGELFLHHDQSLLRTAGEDINPESLSSDELREITLLDGQSLCFFDEFVEQFDGSNWVLDIKAEQGDRALEVLDSRFGDVIRARIDRIWFQVWTDKHRTFVEKAFPGAQLFASKLECYVSGFSVFLGLPAAGRIKANVIYAMTPAFLGRDLYTERMTQPYIERRANLLAFLPEKDEHIRQVLKLPYQFLLTNRRRKSFVG